MPQRILREGILDSEKINELSWGAEVLYRRLMSVADDFGKYDGRLMMIRANCYPLKLHIVGDSDIGKWLQECCTSGLIRRYEVDGKPYIMIINFNQRLRSMKSKYPDPINEDDHVDLTNESIPRRNNDKSNTTDGDMRNGDSTLLTDDRSPPLEVEVEVEVEGDIDVEERASAPTKTKSISVNDTEREDAPPNSGSPPHDPDIRPWKGHPKRSKPNEECAQAFFNDHMANEPFCMKYRIRNLKAWLSVFNAWRAMHQKHESTQSEYVNHLNYWMAKQSNPEDLNPTLEKVTSYAKSSSKNTSDPVGRVKSQFSDIDDIQRRLGLS